jgi:hypothetical protein
MQRTDSIPASARESFIGDAMSENTGKPGTSLISGTSMREDS